MLKNLCRSLACALLPLLAAVPLAQAESSGRPLTLMVPYPAGAASDLTARTLSEGIGQALGTTVVVENMGGAAGALAAGRVLGAPADGAMLFQGSPSELILSGLINKAVRYKPQDFELVAPVAVSPLVLVARTDLPANSIDELTALARARKDQPLSYGSTGPGTLYHLLGELFSKRVGAPAIHVPYKGGSPLIQDLIGGRLDFAFMPYQSFYADYARDGRIKLVGSMSAKPLPPPFESLQNASDSRDLKGFDYTIWTAYLVKKGTPQPVAKKLGEAVAEALKSPRARKTLEAQAKTLYEPMSLDEAQRFYDHEIARYGELVKTVGYEAQ